MEYLTFTFRIRGYSLRDMIEDLAHHMVGVTSAIYRNENYIGNNAFAAEETPIDIVASFQMEKDYILKYEDRVTTLLDEAIYSVTNQIMYSIENSNLPLTYSEYLKSL